MNSVEITFARAWKVVWSYSWRGTVLAFPVIMAIEIPFMFLYWLPRMKANAGKLPDASMGLAFFGLWLLLMTVIFVVFSLAMRWTLKTKWSDFELVMVEREKVEAGNRPINPG